MTETGTNDDRDAVIARIVGQMEQVEIDLATAREDMKAIAASCKDAELTTAEVTAMKRLAKLRVADKVDAERAKMDALHTVGAAVGCDLFQWASRNR